MSKTSLWRCSVVLSNLVEEEEEQVRRWGEGGPAEAVLRI